MMLGSPFLKGLALTVYAFAITGLPNAYAESGPCPSGEPYQVAVTQIDVNGVMRPYFVYEGPLGRGGIPTSADLKDVIRHVCSRADEGYLLADERREDAASPDFPSLPSLSN